MDKAQSKFGGLTRGQMRCIHKSKQPVAELAKFYGVPVKTILGVKIVIGRSRKAWQTRQGAA